ncbi:MAG: TM2 domain-containing protein [Akkermansia sp.]|nr:TM2 domain-containing protein [Akkermansia sp.]
MPKSRLAYILLAIFLGTLGVHNFFAGYTGRGVTQLLLTLISFGFLAPVVWVWAIVEICTVTKDAQGVDFVN